jgi:hypothetical protein
MSVSDSRGRSPATEFLNVDLDIYSRFDLQPLVKALGKKVIILYVGRERRKYSHISKLPVTLRLRIRLMRPSRLGSHRVSFETEKPAPDILRLQVSRVCLKITG